MDQDSIDKRKILFLIKELFRATSSSLNEQNNNLQEFNLHGFPQKKNKRIREIIFEVLDNELQEGKLEKDIPTSFPTERNVISFPRNNVIPFQRN